MSQNFYNNAKLSYTINGRMKILNVDVDLVYNN